MQRAAHGLAYAVLDLLGGGYGRRVLLLVGSGDNGGDALYAGAVLARRGAYVEAWLLSDRAHEGGVAALGQAGGRVRRLDTPSPGGSGYSTTETTRRLDTPSPGGSGYSTTETGGRVRRLDTHSPGGSGYSTTEPTRLDTPSPGDSGYSTIEPTRLDTPSPGGSGYSTTEPTEPRWSSRERVQRATVSRPRNFDVVVDGIVGIGGRPPLRADAVAA